MCGHHHHHGMTGHTGHTGHTGSMDPALEDPRRIVQLRYARGEITREEYLQMMADLEGTPSTQGTGSSHQHHHGA